MQTPVVVLQRCVSGHASSSLHGMISGILQVRVAGSQNAPPVQSMLLLQSLWRNSAQRPPRQISPSAQSRL